MELLWNFSENTFKASSGADRTACMAYLQTFWVAGVVWRGTVRLLTDVEL
jgi:hypothetical protein